MARIDFCDFHLLKDLGKGVLVLLSQEEPVVEAMSVELSHEFSVVL